MDTSLVEEGENKGLAEVIEEEAVLDLSSIPPTCLLPLPEGVRGRDAGAASRSRWAVQSASGKPCGAAAAMNARPQWWLTSP